VKETWPHEVLGGRPAATPPASKFNPTKLIGNGRCAESKARCDDAKMVGLTVAIGAMFVAPTGHGGGAVERLCRRDSAALGQGMAKLRADQLLVDRGLAESRTRAQSLIMAGLVFAGERKIDKSGQTLPADTVLDVRGRDHPWVSRGGIKLAHGLDHFGWDVTGAVAIDVGSSTGGFTDVLLTRGAARVYAVDSGTNQLAWKLRQDDRVIVHEQTSARILTAAHIPELVDLIVCDASFIGLAKVLDVPLGFARAGARLMALVKPQFEAGRGEVGKGGVVRDGAVHQRVCDEVAVWVAARGWRVDGVVASPITGPEGNVEFLLAATAVPA
jgi:23S rRNA (cytidine1920-2'-O)/16S rRNA (cytidine1409-2'-O)-methyltransferase